MGCGDQGREADAVVGRKGIGGAACFCRRRPTKLWLVILEQIEDAYGLCRLPEEALPSDQSEAQGHHAQTG